MPDEAKQLLEAFAMAAMQTVKPPVFYVGERETERSLHEWANQVWRMAGAMLDQHPNGRVKR